MQFKTIMDDIYMLLMYMMLNRDITVYIFYYKMRLLNKF